MTSEAQSPKNQHVEPIPYFESRSVNTAPAPRLLLIAYNFPPDCAVGGLRWARMAHHFQANGWDFDVLTREIRPGEQSDVDLLAGLPPGIRIFTVRSSEPLRTRFQRAIWPKLRAVFPSNTSRGVDAISQGDILKPQAGTRRFIRSYFARLAYARDGKWAKAAIRIGNQLLGVGEYAAVISSGPPHMVHEAGRQLATSFGLPHIVDMRDPWSLNERIQEYLASPVWLQLARHYEQAIVRDAALVTMNTAASCRAMRALYPTHADKIHVIRNGCDNEPLPRPQRPSHFSIRFAGTIYMDRDPRLFFRAARHVVDELALTPRQFEIAFAGAVDRYAGGSTMRIAEEEGLAEYVQIHSLLPRNDAMNFLAEATVLLSLPQDCKLAIPAKIYEYLRFDAWLLILASSDSSTADLLQNTDADVTDPNDVHAISSVIRRRYEQFQHGVMPVAIGNSGQFDRSVQAMRLIELIREIGGESKAAMAPAIGSNQDTLEKRPQG